MEIIHLILGKANPQRMNGVNKVVYQLATQQAASGRKVAVWGITHNLEHTYGERNFETRLFPALRNKFRIHKSLKAALLTKKEGTVFHLHGGWIPTYAGLSKFLNKHQLPFVLTPHGAYNTIARQRSWWRKQLYFQLFEKDLLKRSQRVHAIGQSELSGLQELYPNEKSLLLPYGFEGDSLHKSTFPPEDQLIFGFVGRLDIYTKGLDLLIHAFHAFQTQYSQATLWIVGDGPERRQLESMISETGIRNIVLWGSKYGNEKTALMQRMHLFVHPSRNEGLPSAVLEAAHLGIPCIVSEATNVGSYITEFQAGITIRNENTADLLQAFQAAHATQASGLWQCWSDNARKMVHKAFSWSKLLPQYDLLYR